VKKRHRIPSITKRLITRNTNKNLRTWSLPYPGWNLRRAILELGAGGEWFTSTAIVKRYGVSRFTVSGQLTAMRKAGWIERQHIQGRPTAPHWTHADMAEESGIYPGMRKMRARARWAYRITHVGLDWLERLRNGERDVIGRARSEVLATLASWMPGRGPLPRRVVMARLGAPRWNAVGWCSANYGNPWPVYGRLGYWEWREWSREELFS
jgi:hypothetical protein